MVCDSFTSNYQSRVFKQYSVGSITMMVYTNLFSTAFTALGLCLTQELTDVSRFVSENPAILPHIFLMAVCSAIGQLFIFHTIKTYGPLVFATIQTVRQLLSIFNSFVQFGHEVVPMELLGIGIVFLALGAQIGLRYRASRRPEVRPAAAAKGGVRAASDRGDAKDSEREDCADDDSDGSRTDAGGGVSEAHQTLLRKGHQTNQQQQLL
mmetsp:Transcript_41942/g.136074  ORF Transcript_41942/g.136074 Transcript_41942/m.136074 type:complete len:209 (+) Transcript_41942:845-1471(+)